MLQFIKGNGVLEYRALLEKTHDFDESIFLDTDNNRLYFNGELLNDHDVSIFSVKSVGADYIDKTSYKFVANGNEVVIDSAIIPEIVNGKVVLRDIYTQTDYAQDGLMTSKDKFLIESMADVLGFNITYEYYYENDNVNYNAYQKDGRWVYDYYSPDEPDYVIETRRITDESRIHVRSMKIDQTKDHLNMFDGSSVPDGKTMVISHGGLHAGTTVEQLEEKTVSEVLCDILFEGAAPVKVCDSSLFIKFREGSSYHGYIEVGSKYPLKRDFEYVFTPETWQCMSPEDGSPLGEPQPLVELDRVEYYVLDWESVDLVGRDDDDSHDCVDIDDIYDNLEDDVLINLDASNYMKHWTDYAIEDGDRCEYFAVAYYNGVANAKDSDGNDHYEDGAGNPVYYAQGIDGSVRSNKLKLSNNSRDGKHTVVLTEFDVIAGWKICSNSKNVSKESLWSSKDIEPGDGEFAGNDELFTSPYFTNDTSAIYMQWPSATTAEQKFYVYIPVKYKIDSVGAANDTAFDDWSVEIDATVVDEDYKITNSNGIEGSYKKYLLDKCSGITTVKINLSKVNG